MPRLTRVGVFAPLLQSPMVKCLYRWASLCPPHNSPGRFKELRPLHSASLSLRLIVVLLLLLLLLFLVFHPHTRDGSKHSHQGG